MDQVKKFLSKNLLVRVSAVRCTEVVREVIKRQNANPLAAIALGRTVSGTMLLASQLREGHLISVDIDGDGGLGQIFAEASFKGSCRAYIQNPQYAPESEINAIGQAVGKGQLSVSHSASEGKTPFRGTVELVSGEIGDDIAHYLRQSQQTPSLVAVTCDLDQEGELREAGGIMIEMMPGATDEIIDAVESAANLVGPLSGHLRDGVDLADICKMYLKDIPFEEVPHPCKVKFSCRCSRERVIRSIVLLGAEEIAKLKIETEQIEGRCDFCGAVYRISSDELDAHLSKQNEGLH